MSKMSKLIKFINELGIGHSLGSSSGFSASGSSSGSSTFPFNGFGTSGTSGVAGTSGTMGFPGWTTPGQYNDPIEGNQVFITSPQMQSIGVLDGNIGAPKIPETPKKSIELIEEEPGSISTKRKLRVE